MIKLLIIILLAFNSLFACAQKPDVLIFNGDTCNIFSNPLEAYFNKNKEMRVRARGFSSTGLYRGYIAWFIIKGNVLYVTDIKIQKIDSNTIVDNKKFIEIIRNDLNWVSVFRDIFNQDTLKFVDWYSGMLIIPKGKRIKCVMSGYASEYEKYTLINIENGIVKFIKDMTNKEYQNYRQLKFKEYKMSKEYRDDIENIFKNDQDTSNKDDLLLKLKF